jgi:hypothetical protein
MERTLKMMRGAAKKSSGKKSSSPGLAALSMGQRIIPAALASVGFLVTFTVRSWHQDLWRPGQATDHALVTTARPTAGAHKTSIATPPLGSSLRFAAVFTQEVARSRAASVAASAAAAAPPDASHYLAERDREVAHSGRLR